MSITVIVTAGIVNTFYIKQLIVYFLYPVVICLIAAIVFFLVMKRRPNAQQFGISEDNIAQQNPLYYEVQPMS